MSPSSRRATLLDTIGPDTLLGLYLAKEPRVWTGIATQDDLLSWDDLNELLNYRPFDPARMRLARDRRTVAHESYTVAGPYGRTVNPSLFHTLLQEGASLVVDAVDRMHPGTGDTAAALERLTRCNVLTNLYASWTATQAFGLHFDDQDVLVVQLAGAKRWQFYAPTRAAVMLHDPVAAPRPTGEPDRDFVLHAGDVLFLPRGWWHGAAAGEGTHSLHVTHTMIPVTGIDLMRWIIPQLHAEEVFRHDLPAHAGPDARAAWAQKLADSVRAIAAAPDVLDRFLAERDVRYDARRSTALPYAVDRGEPPAGRLRLIASRSLVVTGPDGSPLFAAGGMHWRLTAPRHQVALTLADGAAHDLAELRAVVKPEDWDDVHTYLGELVFHGVAVWE
ncbi:cupin domain-containing protein [Actinoplanes sp. CA-252034]|uniref:cupin domain-containing protein n=1 Tax=Actinoplanes sp. CA-252034 TaxID=3239906 RepID=UPI003D974F23